MFVFSDGETNNFTNPFYQNINPAETTNITQRNNLKLMSCESWTINSLQKLQRLSNFIRYSYFVWVVYLELLSLL